jgi:sigma-B regulation protein RsbU (phosphoserine phosphatase)
VQDIVLHEAEVILHPGDLLVAYTDGATEAHRADNTEFGIVGLQATVTALRKGSAHDIVQGTIRALDRFVENEPQFDDVTLVVLKHLPGEQEGRRRHLPSHRRPSSGH